MIQLLDLVHEEVNGLIDQSQDLCDTQRNFASEMGFSCPVEQSTGPGRPRFYISEEVIRGLHDVHGVWKEVAKEARVSYNSKQFYEGDISIPWQLVTQLVQESLDISDARLCENVGKVFQVMPNAGETYITGSL